MRSLLTVLFALLTLLGQTAWAQSLPRFGAPERHVDAELVAATDAIVPGQPLTVGLKLKHQSEWHTYWQVPGDSGLPTRIEWKLPAGFTAGPIEWPHPKRLPTGPLVNFGYDGEILLLTTIQVPADLPVGSRVTLAGKAEWLECKDVCIPGDSDIALTLPVKPTAGPSAQRGAIRRHASADPAAARRRDGPGHDRRQPDQAEPRAAGRQDGKPARILPAARRPDRSRRPAGAEARRRRGRAVPDRGPAGEGGCEGHPGRARRERRARPRAAGSAPSTCRSWPAPWRRSAPRRATSPAATMSLIAALGAALLGGLILNLMPCVFPVLSLKLIGLAQHRHALRIAGRARHRVRVRRRAVVRAARRTADRASAGGQRARLGFPVADALGGREPDGAVLPDRPEPARRLRVHVRQRRRQCEGRGEPDAQERLARQLRAPACSP